MTRPPDPRHGFTLVELSIVLVVIGLLVGGVLVGRDMIRLSGLRAVSSEFERYKGALGAFKVKYMAIPGDMVNATAFWGAAAGGTAEGLDAACMAEVNPTDQRTCNGDGNGLIAEDAGTYHEILRAWQQLGNAGLVEGGFTGVPNGSGSQEIGVNVPASKLSGSGWMLQGLGNYAGDAIFFAANYGNVLNVGPLSGGSMSGQEALSLDQKIDDGFPHTGKMLTYKHAVAPDCIIAGNDAYDADNTEIACLPTLITGF